MTDLNEFLAVEVMGWPLNENHHAFESFYDNGSNSPVWVQDWLPDSDIAQAVECAKALEGFEGFSLKCCGSWQCEIFAAEYAKSQPCLTESAALSLAVARAAGWTG